MLLRSAMVLRKCHSHKICLAALPTNEISAAEGEADSAPAPRPTASQCIIRISGTTHG
jgi:hypothetical protein